MISSYFLNPHALPPLAAALFMALMGAKVLRSGFTKINLYFTAICASVFLWLVGTSVGYMVKEDENLARLWFQLDWAGVSFISVNVYAFSTVLLQIQRPRSIKLGYLLAACFALSTLTFNPQMEGIKRYSWGFYPLRNIPWNVPFFIYFFGYMGQSFIDYIAAYRKTKDPGKKNQIKYMFLALLIAYTGSIDFLPTYGLNIYPAGFLSISGFVAISAYTIIRHRLMDVCLAFRYGTVYSVLALALGGPIAWMVAVWGGWRSVLVASLAPITGVLLAERLMPLLTQWVDYLPLFRGKYENFRNLNRQEQEIRQSLTLEEWQNNLTTASKQALKTNFAVIHPIQSIDAKCPPLLKALQEHTLILKDYLQELVPPDHLASTRQAMESLGVDLCARLTDASGSPAALLCVGPKRDGNIWNDLDLTALWTLARVGEETLRDIQRRESLEQQKRLAALGEMASVVSHEIKTPLAVIQNSMAFLTDRLPPSPDDKVRKHVDIIASQTQSLTSIITGILDYARQRELNLEPGDLNALLRELTGTLSPPENVQMVLNLAKELPKILFDKEEMKQALRNVIQNGIQAMPQGGKLTIATAATPTEVTITISDTGVGIEEKDLPRLFEPFFTTKSQGTGLGLAVVKKVMDRHHGEVKMMSEPGKGTSTKLLIPILEIKSKQ